MIDESTFAKEMKFLINLIKVVVTFIGVGLGVGMMIGSCRGIAQLTESWWMK